MDEPEDEQEHVTKESKKKARRRESGRRSAINATKK
jgi:hypothetical protein